MRDEPIAHYTAADANGDDTFWEHRCGQQPHPLARRRDVGGKVWEILRGWEQQQDDLPDWAEVAEARE